MDTLTGGDTLSIPQFARTFSYEDGSGSDGGRLTIDLTKTSSRTSVWPWVGMARCCFGVACIVAWFHNTVVLKGTPEYDALKRATERALLEVKEPCEQTFAAGARSRKALQRATECLQRRG